MRGSRELRLLSTASKDHVQAKGFSEAYEFNTTQCTCKMKGIEWKRQEY
jgi:hypothetical protein